METKYSRRNVNFLRLGVSAQIHNRQMEHENVCANGSQTCRDCKIHEIKKISIIPPEALLNESRFDSCAGSSCAVCGQDCEVIVQKRW